MLIMLHHPFGNWIALRIHMRMSKGKTVHVNIPDLTSMTTLETVDHPAKLHLVIIRLHHHLADKDFNVIPFLESIFSTAFTSTAFWSSAERSH